MQSLISICEGILGDIDKNIEDVVELRDRLEKDLAWVLRVRESDAPYYEAALFNVTQDGFRRAVKETAEFKEIFANFIFMARSPWDCFNFDECENWEERQYNKAPTTTNTDIVDAEPNDYRWNWIGSNSFYHFFWDPEYTHSLDQEDLLDSGKCQQYSKKLLAIAKKYGLNLKPIF